MQEKSLEKLVDELSDAIDDLSDATREVTAYLNIVSESVEKNVDHADIAHIRHGRKAALMAVKKLRR